MSGRANSASFRFLHASDFRLEIPVLGVNHVPDHLRDALIDAPYRAALKVFDTAVSERVDFVVLAGNITNPRAAGPWGVNFLQEQFERLAGEQIAVYWSCGPADRTDLWPTATPLPSNVRVFSAERVASISHRRDDQTIVTIQGCSHRDSRIVRAAEFASDPKHFCVAVTHGAASPEDLRASSVDYWALGGRHDRHALFTSPNIAQYSGSPQGRSPDEDDAHGCTLVDVDEAGLVTRQMIPTDVVRWHTERIELPDHMDKQGLLRQLRDRSRQLGQIHTDKLTILRWKVTDSDQLTDTRSDFLAAQLRQSDLAQELVSKLRNEFGMSVPGVWTESLTADTPSVYPAGWYEEDTVLGDLLRAVQYYQKEKHEPVDLDSWEAETPLNPELIEALRISGDADRDSVLRHVAALGVDLLRGDRVLSEELVSVPSWPENGDRRENFEAHP